MAERRNYLSSLTSERAVQDGEDHRSGPNGKFVIGEGSGWIFEIREENQRAARFSIKRHIRLGGDPVELRDIGHGEYHGHVHIGSDEEKEHHYIADPRWATGNFTVDIYDAG